MLDVYGISQQYQYQAAKKAFLLIDEGVTKIVVECNSVYNAGNGLISCK